MCMWQVSLNHLPSKLVGVVQKIKEEKKKVGEPMAQYAPGCGSLNKQVSSCGGSLLVGCINLCFSVAASLLGGGPLLHALHKEPSKALE